MSNTCWKGAMEGRFGASQTDTTGVISDLKSMESLESVKSVGTS